jgi:hypothetical protein
MKLYFKINERLKKIFNYFSIFTIVLGTTFGSLNSAYAGTITLNADSTGGPAVLLTGDGAVDIAVNGDDDLAMGLFDATLTLGNNGADQIFGAVSAGADAVLTLTTLQATAEKGTTQTFEGAVTFTAGGAIAIVTAGDKNYNVVFESDVSAGAADATITVEGDAGNATTTTVKFAGDVTGVVSLDDIAGAVVMQLNGTTQTVNQAIGAVGDDEATLKVSSTLATISGAVGGVDKVLASVTIDESKAATFSSTVDATAITVTGTGTFDGAVGSETAATAITLTANKGTATFGSTVAATTLTANGGTTSSFDGKFTGTDLVLKGTSTLTGKAHAITKLTTASTTTITIPKTTVSGETIFTSTGQTSAAIDGGTMYMPVNFANGQTITLFNAATNATNATATATEFDDIIVDTALVNYDAVAATAKVNIVATEKSESTVSSELGVTSNIAKAFKQARDSAINDTNADGTAEDAFNNALTATNGYNSSEDTALAKQVAPQDDMISGSTFATKAMTGSLQGIMSNRMAALRSGDAYYGSGMSAGSLSANSGFIQVFGTNAEQKNKTVGSGTQFGYDASSAGVALGFDGITDNGSVVGLSLSMSETDVDGKGTGKSKNDIDSYTASIYMDKSTDAGYVEGSLTVGLNENNSSRIVNTAGLNRTYKGDYDSEQVSLKIGGGKPNAVGMSGYVTPFGSITATRISTDAYTETSTTANDNLRLRVAQDDVDSVVGTVGLKYHKVLDNGGSPMISLAINNEFGDSTINSTNTYQGGGSSFTTSTDVEELSATLGLGYSFSSDNASIEFAYEADANDDDYLSHYGSIKLVSKF